MMKTARRIILSLMAGILITSLSQTAFAAGNAGNRLIKKLIHPDITRVLVVAQGNIWMNPDVCQKSNQLVLAAGKLANDKVYREMFAMLLSAQVSERRVEIRTSGCQAVNGTEFPVIIQVTLL